MSINERLKEGSERYQAFKEKTLPSFEAKAKEYGFFGAIPSSIRKTLLVVFVILLFVIGMLGFALGIAAAVIIFSYWGHNFSYLGDSLGLAGENKLFYAIIYFLLLIIGQMALSAMSRSRYVGLPRDLEERKLKLDKWIDKDGYFSELMVSMMRWELDHFGKFYYKIHLLVFLSSFFALLIK